jgi:hypothetical protein
MEAHERSWARFAYLAELLDGVNGAIRAALAGGDDDDHTGQLLERAWVEMMVRDHFGRSTVLGQTWERFMIGDVELAARIGRQRQRSCGRAS